MAVEGVPGGKMRRMRRGEKACRTSTRLFCGTWENSGVKCLRCRVPPARDHVSSLFMFRSDQVNSYYNESLHVEADLFPFWA
jgi:hypothetical protein